MGRRDVIEAVARIEERLQGHTEILVDVQAQARKTNGRVSKLERAWWYARGFAGAVAVGVSLLAATGHLHIH